MIRGASGSSARSRAASSLSGWWRAQPHDSPVEVRRTNASASGAAGVPSTPAASATDSRPTDTSRFIPSSSAAASATAASRSVVAHAPHAAARNARAARSSTPEHRTARPAASNRRAEGDALRDLRAPAGGRGRPRRRAPCRERHRAHRAALHGASTIPPTSQRVPLARASRVNAASEPSSKDRAPPPSARSRVRRSPRAVPRPPSPHGARAPCARASRRAVRARNADATSPDVGEHRIERRPPSIRPGRSATDRFRASGAAATFDSLPQSVASRWEGAPRGSRPWSRACRGDSRWRALPA